MKAKQTKSDFKRRYEEEYLPIIKIGAANKSMVEQAADILGRPMSDIEREFHELFFKTYLEEKNLVVIKEKVAVGKVFKNVHPHVLKK